MSGSISSPVKVGETLPLSVQLSLDDTDKYIECVIRNAQGVEIPASPVVLGHVANGLYQNLGVTMPDTENVTAIYRVYDDISLTIRSDRYPESGMDVFTKDEVEQLVAAIAAQNIQGDLIGVIQSDDLFAYLVESTELEVLLLEDVSQGSIESDQVYSNIQENQNDFLGVIE